MTRSATSKARRKAELPKAWNTRGACPHCGTIALMTRDHIIKQQHGAGAFIHGDTRNLRPMCAECNNLVDQCGQCVAALACIRAVPGNVWKVSKAWRMSYVAETMRELRA